MVKRVLLVLVWALFLNSFLHAQLVFKIELDGSQMVPPVSTPATGSGWLFLYEDLGSIRFNFTYAKLQGEYTQAYFNVGKPGVVGDTVTSIIVDNNNADNVWNPLPDSLIGHLLADDMFITVRSSLYPGGEIRGQIKKIRGFGYPLSLRGSSVDPPVETEATGTGYLVINNDARSIDYHFTVQGLSSAISHASFHSGELGVNGPEVKVITISDSTVDGSWTDVPDSVMMDLIKSRLYLKISTVNNPSGELRANVFRHGELMFRISLNGSQVIPPSATVASGTGWAVLSANLSKVNYDITFTKLSSPITSAYFNTADVGANGDTLISLNAQANRISGVWDFITSEEFLLLIKKKVYLIVNTANYPNGEIRGQLEFIKGIGFTVSLSGPGVIPASSSTAQGTGWFVISNSDRETDTAYYQFTTAGLSSAIGEAHFHRGNYANYGPELAPILFTDSTISSGWKITDNKIYEDLMRGNIYSDIHTANYPNGEVRGQVYFSNVQSGNTVDVKNEGAQVPTGYSLEQNYPNPFNPVTIINYSVPVEQFVKIKVYNILGQETAVLVNEVVKPGSYKVNWNASDFASGVYLYKIEAGTFTSTRKMLLLK